MADIRIIKRFSKLPFFCGVQDAPFKKTGLPDFLPFSLCYSPSQNLFIQQPDGEVMRSLEKAYLVEGLQAITPLEHDSFTRWRADEFLAILKKISIGVNGKKILEIGCSTGYLLHILKNAGADVRGCEPGPLASMAVEKYHIPVDQIFFNPDSYDREYDIVYLLTVLEHIASPAKFIQDITRILKRGGMIIVLVPDCSREIIQGDPGMIMHEHWSYFTENSLKQILQLNGFSRVQTRTTDHGTLYGWGYWEGDDVFHRKEKCPVDSVEFAKEKQYAERFERITSRIDDWFRRLVEEDKRVGLYGASNGAATILSLVNYKDVNLQIFDGDPLKKGKFLPCCPIEIQHSEELKNNPPDSVLIIPMNFSRQIRQHLKSSLAVPPEVAVHDLTRFMR